MRFDTSWLCQRRIIYPQIIDFIDKIMEVRVSYCCICGRVAHHTESYHCLIGDDVYHYCHWHSWIGKWLRRKFMRKEVILDK